MDIGISVFNAHLSTARFIVHVRSSGAIVLQNYKERGNYLAINKGKLIGTVSSYMRTGVLDVCVCVAVCFVS